MNLPHARATILSLTLLSLLSGCISSDAQLLAVNQKRSYALQANLPAKPVGPTRFNNLKMLSFNSQPPFEACNLVVKRANGETVMDYYTAWVAAPHELIRVQSMNYLRKSGLFKAVYDSSSGVLAPMGLEGTVEQILLDFHKERPMAVITLRFTIIDETAADFKMLWSAEATGSAPLESTDSNAIVSAFDAALTQALSKLTSELKTVSL
jgi:ABC-type uncharacterized transport system auxiliary subunit